MGSAFFFLLAALVTATTIFELLSLEFDPITIGLRSIAFLLLFVFLVQYVRDWKKIGT
jgi:hypothetical protein